MNFLLCFFGLTKLRLFKYRSKLYINCANLILESGFAQTGNYVFARKTKKGGRRIFCLYHFYADGLCLNIYYPQERSILIKNIGDMKTQLNRFKDE